MPFACDHGRDEVFRNGTEERKEAAGQKAPASKHTAEDGAVGPARDGDHRSDCAEEAERAGSKESCGGEEGADSDTQPRI